MQAMAPSTPDLLSLTRQPSHPPNYGVRAADIHAPQVGEDSIDYSFPIAGSKDKGLALGFCGQLCGALATLAGSALSRCCPCGPRQGLS